MFEVLTLWDVHIEFTYNSLVIHCFINYSLFVTVMSIWYGWMDGSLKGP